MLTTGTVRDRAEQGRKKGEREGESSTIFTIIKEIRMESIKRKERKYESVILKILRLDL